MCAIRHIEKNYSKSQLSEVRKCKKAQSSREYLSEWLCFREIFIEIPNSSEITLLCYFLKFPSLFRLIRPDPLTHKNVSEIF